MNEIQKVLNKSMTSGETKSEKWNRDLKEEVTLENIIPEPELRWFQLRILYRIIPANKYLFMWKIKKISIMYTLCS